MGKEVEEMNSVIERIEKNDSKGVYINDDVTVDKEVSTYQYGEECSEKFKSAYIPEIFLKNPTKAIDYCCNYSYEQMCHCLAEYSEFNVGVSQFSHPDSSSDEDQDSVMFALDPYDFQQRQETFEKSNLKMFIQDQGSYLSLNDYFKTLCKLIDGDDEAINDWKQKFQTGIADATKSLCGEKNENESESSSSLSSNYVSAYRGTSGLKKRKRRRVLKTSHYR
jgi:hypothetical protein